MPIFHAIAAMSENRVIGNQGKIPWHIPEDFRWFKYKTMGGTLVMGRKTFESIGKSLPGRKTIILTRGTTPIPGVELCSNAQLLIDRVYAAHDALATRPDRAAADAPAAPEWKIPWICGGAEVYRRFLRECRCLYLTRVKRQIEGDTYFPDFESEFSLEQVVHENKEFLIERWYKKGWTHYSPPEAWPFPPS
jgi:dihydrofolate reductase